MQFIANSACRKFHRIQTRNRTYTVTTVRKDMELTRLQHGNNAYKYIIKILIVDRDREIKYLYELNRARNFFTLGGTRRDCLERNDRVTFTS